MEPPMRHHLAVLYRAYVTQIIHGRKTVECRLGEMGYPPHGFVQVGDLVWLKDVSGPVRAVVRVKEVRSIPLGGRGALERVRREWNEKVLAPVSFWRARRQASVATLIELGDLCAFRPFRIIKSDRRDWVRLSHPPVPGRPLRTAGAGKRTLGRRGSARQRARLGRPEAWTGTRKARSFTAAGGIEGRPRFEDRQSAEDEYGWSDGQTRARSSLESEHWFGRGAGGLHGLG